eukprot:TRINITY_DN10586_c0_g1_i1.p1 TRINITY_DN10586_c0_g1~~TRINITY_DN10586_c0_g1_i1.p1  ORF type:complete len:427 (-),score=131.31 TRINITY_DN10586_c0_g1_i1:42-1262(-)
MTSNPEPLKDSKEKAEKSSNHAITGQIQVKITYFPPERDLRSTGIGDEQHRGKLNVQVVGCTGLASCDSNGLADPYVCVHFRKYEKRTKVVKKNLNPVFEESFDFKVKNVREGEDNETNECLCEDDEVKLVVWDWNALGTHSFDGEAVVPFLGKLLKDRETHEGFYNLHQKTSSGKKRFMSFSKKKSEGSVLNDSGSKTPPTHFETLPPSEKIEVEKEKEKAVELKPESSDPLDVRAFELHKSLIHYENIAIYIDAILLGRRPAELYGGVALCNLILLFFIYFDLSVLSFIILCLMNAVVIPWISEFVEINVPWDKLLGASYQSRARESFQDAAFLSQEWKRFREQFSEFRHNTLKLAGVFIVAGLLGHFIPNWILFLLAINGSFFYVQSLLKKHAAQRELTKKNQ